MIAPRSRTIWYLKLVVNPHDSIAMQRVINNPPRGLGKTSMETIERIALETGTSMWGAIHETIRQQLLPPRALSALNSFRELIEDGRAMFLGTFRERVQETSAVKSAVESASDSVEDFQHSMDFSPAEFEDATDFSAEMFGADDAGLHSTAGDSRSFDSSGQNQAGFAQDDNLIGGNTTSARNDNSEEGAVPE